jgi:hypothetical protein
LLQVAGNWVLDPKLAETAVGICESDFLSWCQKAEFEVSRIDYGSWCGRSAYLSYQDLVVLRRIK